VDSPQILDQKAHQFFSNDQMLFQKNEDLSQERKSKTPSKSSFYLNFQ